MKPWFNPYASSVTLCFISALLSAGDQQRELQAFRLMCILVTNHICHTRNILWGQIKAH